MRTYRSPDCKSLMVPRKWRRPNKIAREPITWRKRTRRSTSLWRPGSGRSSNPVVAMLRELMRETAPDATEVMDYGIPAYKGRRILVVISPTKKDITFAFSRGAEFEDKYRTAAG